MKTFLTSDHHFGHKNIWNFTDNDGNRIRQWADNREDGERIMIERWNTIVSNQDRVYVLGDFAMNRRGLEKARELKGRKILVKGNHDNCKLSEYIELFDDVIAAKKLDRFYLTHIPIHPNSIPMWCAQNIHGHTHANHVRMIGDSSDHDIRDIRYRNVSVEVTDAAPLDFNDIKNDAKWRGLIS